MINSDVSIVIPTWNGLDLLKRFLPSVIVAANYTIEHLHNRVEILIVDDGGTDNTMGWLSEQGFSLVQSSSIANQCPQTAELKMLRNEKNIGFGETCNNGIKAAQYRLIYLLYLCQWKFELLPRHPPGLRVYFYCENPSHTSPTP